MPLSREKRRAYRRVDFLHTRDDPEKWDDFMRHVRRKSFTKAVRKDSRSDDKLARHADQMNRLVRGKVKDAVLGDHGKTYNIVRLKGGGGEYGCTCPDWRYKQSVSPAGEQDCKHLRRWKKQRGMLKTAGASMHLKIAKDPTRGLKPGDVIVTSMMKREKWGPINPAVRPFVEAFAKVAPKLQGNYGHAAIYVGNGKIVESRQGEGVTMKSLGKGVSNLDYVALRPKTSRKVRMQAAQNAKQMVGGKYSTLDMLGAGADLAAPPKVRKHALKVFQQKAPAKARTAFQCGAIVGGAYHDAGVSLVKGTPWRVTPPAALLGSSKLRPIAKKGTKVVADAPTWAAKDKRQNIGGGLARAAQKLNRTRSSLRSGMAAKMRVNRAVSS